MKAERCLSEGAKAGRPGDKEPGHVQSRSGATGTGEGGTLEKGIGGLGKIHGAIQRNASKF